MKTTEIINAAIQRMPKGKVFTYSDVVKEINQKEAAIKALNRLLAIGKLVKLAKGKFYKPEETIFGKLQPSQDEIVKDLLEKDGRVIGYITGYSIYNQLGLSTQVGNTIQIGRNEVRPSFKRERYTISFVRQKNVITNENIPLLQILDAVRFQKRIPDATPAFIGQRLYILMKDLKRGERKKLVELALKYPPFVRAFTGAVLEELGESALVGSLRKSLNPISSYSLPAGQSLTFAREWNIH